MIASGKSTYAKQAARKGAICMNDDAIVNMLHADDYTLYDKSLKVLYKTIENQVIGTALAMNRVVLVDRGLNVSLEGRRRWLALARSYDVPCEAIVFPFASPTVHAERRFKSDHRGHDFDYWLRVADLHASQYTPPSIAEGFSHIHQISFAEIQQGRVIL
jgi:predicted kinase